MKKTIRIGTRVLSSNRGVVLFVLLVTMFSLSTPYFLASNNVNNVLTQATLTGIIGLAMAIALIGGQFDLSVGVELALAGFVAVHLAGVNTALAFAGAIATGAACGLVNGFVVGVLRVNAFIATLGTMSIIGGLTLLISSQQSASTGAAGFLGIATQQVGPIPVFAIVFIVLALIANWVMKRTSVGTTVRALGANAEFCRLNGVAVTRYTIGMFVLTGMAAGLSGAMTASWVGGADPNAGSTVPLLVISAVILGGVSLYGGEGTIAQAVFGVLALAVLVDGMTLHNISPYYQTVAEGGVLLAVVTLVAILHPEVMTKIWFSSLITRVQSAWMRTTVAPSRERVTGGDLEEIS
jgi:ribose transport system permease protein